MWTPGMETQSAQDWFTAEVERLPRLRNPSGTFLGSGATRNAYACGAGRVQVVLKQKLDRAFARFSSFSHRPQFSV